MNLAIIFAMLFTEPPAQMCFASDVAKLCCPSACAVKDSPKWPQANDVLRGCARGIGCKDVDNWTVGMKCQCPKVKP